MSLSGSENAIRKRVSKTRAHNKLIGEKNVPGQQKWDTWFSKKKLFKIF
jgi:hypothetical protein